VVSYLKLTKNRVFEDTGFLAFSRGGPAMISRKRRALRRAGFTLMEVLVVAAILVMLAGTGVVVYMKYLDDAKKDTAYLGVMSLDQAVQAHKTKHGDYPQTLAELTQAEGTSAAALDQKALTDPWGRLYQYEPQNLHPQKRTPHIFSNGPSGGNAPISNW
jgi:general secretion pathway protein G